MARVSPKHGITKLFKQEGMSFYFSERKVELNLKKRLRYLDYKAEYDKLDKYISRTVKKFIYNKFPTWDTSKYIVTTSIAANLIRIELVSQKIHEPDGVQECINEAINSLEMPNYE
jgi:hypothetical protein